MLRRINLSAVLIVLVCFFLPWEQVSCGGAKDTLSGLDLARHDHALLGLVPVVMLAVVVVALLWRRRGEPELFAVVSAAAGGVSAGLMNDERSRVNDWSAMVSVRLNGWFWVAVLSLLAGVITAVPLCAEEQR